MGFAFRTFILLMIALSALVYFKSVQEIQKRAQGLPIDGKEFCQHLPRELKKKCHSTLGGARFDTIAANLCVSHSGQIDFICLNEIKNSQFQTNMMSLCSGYDTNYLTLCLMALRNKQYSEGERDYCEREESSTERVFCLSRYGRPYG